MRILLSRTDSIGDVMLTLPMVGVIKKRFPEAEVYFLGRSYTEPIISCVENIDGFVNWDELEKLNENVASLSLVKNEFDVCIHVFPVKKIARLVKKSKIPIRIGTTGRAYHWNTCNKLVRFTRQRSDLHEAQLNLKLLKPIGIEGDVSIDELVSLNSFVKTPQASSNIQSLVQKGKFNLILHPKSKGSAIEWGLENFKLLIEQLPRDTYHIFISGTEDDKLSIGDSLPFEKENVTSILGQLSLSEFISFISLCDGLIAASTGPLHIAAAQGIKAIGLYSPRRPIHPGRWAPIGRHAHYLVYDEDCSDCSNGRLCRCIQKIPIEKITALLES